MAAPKSPSVYPPMQPAWVAPVAVAAPNPAGPNNQGVYQYY